MQTLYNTTTSRFRGLLPEHWDISQPVGRGVGTHYAIGGNADSAYEYFLKQFLQAGDRQALDMCELAFFFFVLSTLFFLPPFLVLSCPRTS